MNSIYSISRFNLIATICFLAVGCGSNKPKQENDEIGKNSQIPLQEPGTCSPATQMEITYGNKSAKVNLMLDVNSQDIKLKMTGSPENKNRDRFPLSDKPEKAAASNKNQVEAPDTNARDDWDGVMDIPRSNDLTKKSIQNVLTEIRKSQEFFYRKKYAEALEMAKLSIRKQETAEGYALMGSILFMMGDRSGAKKSWARSLRLNPDMPAITQMLDRLQKESE